MDTPEIKFTKVTNPKKNRDGSWEFQLYNDEKLEGVMNFPTESECKNEHKKYVINGAIGELKEEIELNNNQKILILKEWDKDINNPPGISYLTELCWPDIEKSLMDGRSKYSKVIKRFLVEKGFESDKIENKPKREFGLTPVQIEYIQNNSENMRPLEMSRELFNNQNLSPTSTECRAVLEFWKTIPDENKMATKIVTEEYRPPKRIEKVLERVCRFVKDNKIDKEKISPAHKKQLEALISYLHDYRLIHQINTYENMDDKVLFESSFISYTWDKPDLSAEDVHLYIILCTEVVMSASIQRTINMLQMEQDRQMTEGDGKMSMTLVEAVGTARTEYNSSVKRQETLFKSLITERSKRLNERIGPSFTLMNIVEEMKNEERRKALILDAEKRNENIKGEIKRLSSMDERIVRIWGVDEDLFING